jgi:hypothetical protein
VERPLGQSPVYIGKPVFVGQVSRREGVAAAIEHSFIPGEGDHSAAGEAERFRPGEIKAGDSLLSALVSFGEDQARPE